MLVNEQNVCTDIPPNFHKALELICARLRGQGVNWAVTGSLGFALQGLPLTPNDIDLQTDESGAYAIQRLLSEFVTQQVAYKVSPHIRSFWGLLQIGGLRVEVMGDLQKRLPDGAWEPPVDVMPHRRFIDLDDLHIPVLDLHYEQQAYLLMGRTEKAAMLADWLAQRVVRDE